MLATVYPELAALGGARVPDHREMIKKGGNAAQAGATVWSPDGYALVQGETWGSGLPDTKFWFVDGYHNAINSAGNVNPYGIGAKILVFERLESLPYRYSRYLMRALR